MGIDIVAVEVWGNTVFPLAALKRPLVLSKIIETWPGLWSVIVMAEPQNYQQLSW